MRRAILVILLTTLSASARAQAPADAADTYFRQGNSLYKEQRWADARAAYESAWRLKKSHDIAANLGYAELKLGRFRDAAEHLAFAVKNWPPTGKADKREYAVERLALAKQEVGALTIRVDTDRADVFVDGALVGASPLEDDVFVEPGSHTVEAKRAGLQDAKQVVTVAKGGAQTVMLALPPVPPPPPLAPPPAQLPQPPPAVEKRPLWPAITVGGVALVALGTGAGLTVAANGEASSAATVRAKVGSAGCAMPSAVRAADCTTLAGDLRSQGSLAKGAAGMLVSGGALVLASAGLTVWATRSPAATVRLAPTVGVSGAGVALAGAW